MSHGTPRKCSRCLRGTTVHSLGTAVAETPTVMYMFNKVYIDEYVFKQVSRGIVITVQLTGKR